MTRKEAQLRLNLVKQQLTLINLYKSDFENRLGKKGVEDLINSRLDEFIALTKFLKDESNN